MATLMSFILRTLEPRLNNPANQKLWAPALLNNATDGNGNHVLPITSAKEDFGTLTGPEGDNLALQLAQCWALEGLSDDENGIPQPNSDTPPKPSDPTLWMTSLVLDGLQNLTIWNVDSQPVAEGYSVTLTAIFGKYTGVVNGITMKAPILSGKWNASLPVCSCKIDDTGACPDGAPCDGKHYDTMVGSGNVKITFSNLAAKIKALIAINGSGAQRTLTVNITSVQAVGGAVPSNPLSAPSYKLSCVTLDQHIGSDGYTKSLIKMFVAALEAPEGQTAILATLNNMLMQPDTLTSLNQDVQKFAGTLLDNIFGPVPAGGLPDDAGSQNSATPVDLYIFDRVRTGVENPDSHIYGPLLVDTISDPVVEPWKKDLITIPTMDVGGLDTDVSLNNVVVTGISNIDFPIAQGLLQGSRIQALIRLATLPAGPNRDVNRGGNTVNMPVPVAPPLTLDCGFTYTLEGDDPINGNLTLGMTGLTGQVAIQLAGTEVDTLSVTITSLVLDPSQVVVTIDDVKTDPDDGPTDALLKKFFESPKTLKALTKAINNQLTGQLTDISQDLSKSLRQMLVDQLGS